MKSFYSIFSKIFLWSGVIFLGCSIPIGSYLCKLLKVTNSEFPTFMLIYLCVGILILSVGMFFDSKIENS